MATNTSSLLFAASALAAAALGCASTTPPQELVAARQAYQRAYAGPAQDLAAAELIEAKEALYRAEYAYHEFGDAQVTRDMSYLALRRAELADAEAVKAQNDRKRIEAEKALALAIIQNKDQEVARLRQELAQLKVGHGAKEPKSMRDQLSSVATVKEDKRGTVISLSGSVLFASGKSDLLPGASKGLDLVAEALKSTKQRVTVEGHTDSTGSAELNKALSLARADSARSYLTAHGVPQDRMDVRGVGSANPAASNATPDGRAANRRVEIILEQEPAS